MVIQKKEMIFPHDDQPGGGMPCADAQKPRRISGGTAVNRRNRR